MFSKEISFIGNMGRIRFFIPVSEISLNNVYLVRDMIIEITKTTNDK